jgi:hypothetical protein
MQRCPCARHERIYSKGGRAPLILNLNTGLRGVQVQAPAALPPEKDSEWTGYQKAYLVVSYLQYCTPKRIWSTVEPLITDTLINEHLQ